MTAPEDRVLTYTGFSLGARVMVSKAGLCLSLVRWLPGNYAKGKAFTHFREWTAPEQLTPAQALRTLIDRLEVFYEETCGPLEDDAGV